MRAIGDNLGLAIRSSINMYTIHELNGLEPFRADVFTNKLKKKLKQFSENEQ